MSPMPASTAACAGGITSAATRIVKLDGSATAAAPRIEFRARCRLATAASSASQVKGVPLEGRAGGPARAGDPSGARGAGAGPGAARGASPGAPAAPPAARGGQPVDRIPGAPPVEEGGTFGMLFRPSGVGYVISSDGMLHVVGLPSGKDIQRPAPFLPANARWSAPIAVNTTMYAATSGKCGGAPSGSVGDRSRERGKARHVVEDQRRRRGGRCGVHARTVR